MARSRSEYELGLGMYGEGNVGGALEHLLEAVRLDPENVEALWVLGTLYAFRGEYARAEEYLNRTIQANERLGRAGIPALTPDAKNTLGVVYIHTRRYEDAIRVLQASASDPMNRTPHLAWGNLGWAHFERGELDQAQAALEQAIRLQPRFCAGRYRLAQVFFEKGRVSAGRSDREAEEWFARSEESLDRTLESGQEECKALQEAWLLRGEVRARRGRKNEAIADFERCVELDPQTKTGRLCAQFLEEDS
ncbi:MAG: tetratricopeptide repeat protein [Sandaracinaceae bacterium]|nr:tetratricopeptide repeat protein [Sandaracinaceae bacterium]